MNATLTLPPPPALANPPAPYGYLALDIETADGRPDDAERTVALAYRPDSLTRGTWKPETAGNRIAEAFKARLDKLALLDEAPIVVISLRSDTELRALHTCNAHEPRMIHGGLVEGFTDATAMLIALRNLLDARMTPDTPLVGHNITHFDLRKLRWAYARHGVRPPAALLDRGQAVYDTMTEYGRRFSVAKGECFIALADLLEEFGIPNHKTTADGAMAPQLYRTGQHDALIGYALLDVLAESELFLRMTGQAAGLK